MATNKSQTTEKAHISYSQISTLRDCPKRWLYTRKRPEDNVPNLNLLLGRAFHYALGANFSQKVQTKRDLPVEEVIEAFLTCWNTDIATGHFILGEGEDPSEVAPVGVNMLRHFMKSNAPVLMPKEVEQRYRVDLPGTKYQLVGVVDFIGQITEGPYKDDHIIIDFKTAGRALGNANKDSKTGPPVHIPTATHRLQLASYLLITKMAANARGEDYSGSNSTMIMAVTKAKTPKTCPAYYSVDDSDIQVVLKEISWAIDQIESENVSPNFNGMFCTKKSCAWYDECHKEEGRSTDEYLKRLAFEKMGLPYDKEEE